MALALGSLWLLNASETVRTARIQTCSWVSMAHAIGSLLLFFYARIQACSWVAIALALGSLWVLNAFGTAKDARVQACSWVSMALALGSLWLLLLGLYGF